MNKEIRTFLLFEKLVDNGVGGEKPASTHVDCANALALVASGCNFCHLLGIVCVQNVVNALSDQGHDEGGPSWTNGVVEERGWFGIKAGVGNVASVVVEPTESEVAVDGEEVM